MFACMHAFKGVHMLVCARPFSRVRLRSPLRLRSCVLHALAPLGRPTCARIAVVSSLPVSSRLQGTMRLRRCGAWVCARVCVCGGGGGGGGCSFRSFRASGGPSVASAAVAPASRARCVRCKERLLRALAPALRRQTESHHGQLRITGARAGALRGSVVGAQ